MRLSAVITNFNTWELAERCIGGIRQNSSPPLDRIVLVDDCSTEPAPGLPSYVTVIRNAMNLGYVASVNVGMRNSTGDVVVLLDSDARPVTEMIRPLVERFSRHPRLGALGFRTTDAGGKETGSSEPTPGVLDLLLGQRAARSFRRRWRSPNRRLLLYSCAVAVRKEAFDSVGGFDEAFDFLDADLDFSWRLQESGWDVGVEPRLVAVHTGGGSSQSTSRRVLRYHRNRWRLLEKHKALRLRPLLKSCLALRHACEWVILRVAGRALFDPQVLGDKLAGRRALLSSVWSGYGNEAVTRPPASST